MNYSNAESALPNNESENQSKPLESNKNKAEKARRYICKIKGIILPYTLSFILYNLQNHHIHLVHRIQFVLYHLHFRKTEL